MAKNLKAAFTLSNGVEHPEIYVVCKASYQDGDIYGVWIDTTQPMPDILKQIALMQYEGEHGDDEMLSKGYCPDPDTYFIHAHIGFYDVDIYGNAKIEDIRAYGLFIAQYGELGARLIAYYEGTLDAAKEVIEQRYQGAYESELEYATQIFNKICLGTIPLELQNWIDYETFKTTIFKQHFFSIDVEAKTHVFFEWSGEPEFKECLEGFLMPFVNTGLRPID